MAALIPIVAFLVSVCIVSLAWKPIAWLLPLGTLLVSAIFLYVALQATTIYELEAWVVCMMVIGCPILVGSFLGAIIRGLSSGRDGGAADRERPAPFDSSF